MRILITNCHLIYPHGSEIWTEVVARELMRRGHQVFLYSPEIGAYHSKCLRDIPTIVSTGERMEGGFEAAILQHLNVLREDRFWNEAIKGLLPSPEVWPSSCVAVHSAQ